MGELAGLRELEKLGWRALSTKCLRPGEWVQHCGECFRSSYLNICICATFSVKKTDDVNVVKGMVGGMIKARRWLRNMGWRNWSWHCGKGSAGGSE